jgi:ribosome-associated protein
VPGHITINADLAIPLTEIQFTASRASGPGGQHVNTADTRVQLRWDIRHSAVLSDEQRERIERSLANRINQAGELVLTSGTRRSQHQNRQEVVARLITLVSEALVPRPPRRPTKPPAAAGEQRLQEKKRRSEIKRQRQKPDDTD